MLLQAIFDAANTETELKVLLGALTSKLEIARHNDAKRLLLLRAEARHQEVLAPTRPKTKPHICGGHFNFSGMPIEAF